jgi:RNA polymerase sigma factor (sigma-70 family)
MQYADLYQEHARDILRYIRRYVFSSEDAQDLVVEVFLAALESQIPLTLPGNQQRAWLQRVARNKVIDYQRRVTTRPTVGLNEVFNSPFDMDHHSPERVALRSEELDILRSHLATLPELQRTILQLRFGHGLRTKEIALMLNKSDDAIRSMLARSLQFLRRLYIESEEDQLHG